ncbi:glyoxalase [Actinosynnema sp. ALI-1.44]|uniref:VOC family protein n=1 Tax=Actinosynnema sp. ALI-1.44 TaxID=1933779 RepID=UPI00097BCC67|nr:VOC family protein [Actinosynnema sp. ALI-1.44]ONI79785.1 glyoxalase [Actinosynnema sp. ALI-1.44]
MTVRLNAFSIVTADMGRSLAFYRLLGLDIPASADSEGHVEVTLPGGLRLLWDSEETIRSFHPDWSRRGSDGMAMAFEADSPADVDKVYAQLVDAGYHGELEPWDAFWGQRYAMVLDPDGNGVDLFAAL